MELRDGLGTAVYNVGTSKIDFPPGVPKSRLPGKKPTKSKVSKKALVLQLASPPASTEASTVLSELASDPGTTDSISRCLVALPASPVTLFVDSGAGQSLCSVGTAFSDLQPCRVEVAGVAGSLPIHGCGTASFVVRDHDGKSLIMMIPNC